MKHFKILTTLILSSVILFYSCNDTTKSPKETDSETSEVEATTTAPTVVTPAAALKEPAQNASGVWHYTCRIGCPGGAGTATKCDTCGNVLVHNTTYHSNNNAASAPFASPNSNTTANTPAAPKTPEPAQNASGVWHYTCAKGCAGGGGSAGNCSSCNGALAHNSVYHN